MFQNAGDFQEILEEFDIAPKMAGKKCFLAPLDPIAAESMAIWLLDDDVSRGFMNYDCAETVEDCETSIAALQVGEGNRLFSIYDRADGSMIGACCIFDVSSRDRTGSVSIFIGDGGYRGQGHGTEVMEMLCAFGFDALNLNNIDLKVASFNERAIKCYEHVGFEECGRRHNAYFMDGKYHDVVYMELLADRWRSRRLDGMEDR